MAAPIGGDYVARMLSPLAPEFPAQAGSEVVAEARRLIAEARSLRAHLRRELERFTSVRVGATAPRRVTPPSVPPPQTP